MCSSEREGTSTVGGGERGVTDAVCDVCGNGEDSIKSVPAPSGASGLQARVEGSTEGKDGISVDSEASGPQARVEGSTEGISVDSEASGPQGKVETGCSDETFQVKDVESGGGSLSGVKGSERQQCSSTRRRPRRRYGRKPKRRVRRAPVQSEPPGGESEHISDTGVRHSAVEGEECGGKRPKLLTEDRRQDGESEREPVLGGDEESQGEPVSGGSEEGRGEPVSGGSEEGRGEPVSGGSEEGRGEPVSGGSEEGRGEPVSGGSEEGRGEPASGGSEEGRGKPVSEGSEEGRGEPVSGGGESRGEPVSGEGGERDVKQSKAPAEVDTFSKETGPGGGQQDSNLEPTFVKDPESCLEPHLPQAKRKAPSRRTTRKKKVRPSKRRSCLPDKRSETEVTTMADNPTNTNTLEVEQSITGGGEEGSTAGVREEGSVTGGREEGCVTGGGEEGCVTGGGEEGSITGGGEEGSVTGGREEGSITGGREGSPEIPLQNSTRVCSDEHVGTSRPSKLSATLCCDSSLLPTTKRRKTLPSKRAREASQLSIVDTEVGTSHSVCVCVYTLERVI